MIKYDIWKIKYCGKDCNVLCYMNISDINIAHYSCNDWNKYAANIGNAFEVREYKEIEKK